MTGAPVPSAPLPPAPGAASLRAQRLAQLGLVANVVLAMAKLVAGLVGNSYALVADAAESLLDVVSSLLVWAGFRVAARPPDADHPYGHGKAEALAALGVAGFVFLMSGVVGYHAVREIITPHAAPAWWTLLVLALVVAVKLWFSGRMLTAGEATGSTALGVEALHHWSDAMTSAAAFVGIVLALWGGPGWEVADDWAALFACAVIAFNGATMVLKAQGDVMDAAMPAGFEREVRALALAVPIIGIGAII